MALFSSKKKGETVNPPASASSAPGASAAPARAAVVKDKKARPPKSALKNGVITGLNIGNATIKAVEVTAKNGQLSVTRLASVATPPDAFQNGNVLSVTSLSNAIKALWKTGGFKGNAVISSVSGTGALVVRVIEVPLMSDAQLADAMRADAQLYIPFPPTEVQMDFKALRELPSDPDAGTMDVLLAAAQSEIIDLHIKALQAARLDPRAVDVEPIAAGRALSLQKRAESNGLPVDYNEISAIANIGAFGTEISLLRGDVLVFTRTISAGGNSISQSIADALGMPLAEGERLKIEQCDALAPEGYGGANAGDDFGFGGPGGGFGGEFDDFGLGTAPATNSMPGATTVLDAPSQSAAASGDPFDLDFFNQGPKSEPGAGHSQKEGEPAPDAFSFDDLLMPQPTQPAPPVESAGQMSAQPSLTAPSFNFDFDLPEQDLPAAQEGVPATVPQTRPASAGDLGVFGSLAPPTTGNAPIESAPARVEPPSAPMSSAFDFSDFDLPTVDPATPPTIPTSSFGATIAPDVLPVPVAPEASVPTFSTPVVPVAAPAPVIPASTGFSFDEPTVESAIPAAPSFSLDKSPATDELSSAQVVENPASDEGFDLDTVFGEPQEQTAPVSLSKTGLVPGTVTPLATVSASSPLDTVVPLNTVTPATMPLDEGLAVEGLNVGATDFDFGGAGDDLGDFGAGLSSGNSLDSSSLYSALAPAVEELANEISRSLSFYLERVPDAALSRIYLTGGGALLKNLDVYLTGRLGAPTSVFNPLQLLPVSAPASPLTTQGPLYTVALGLALRDFVD